MTVGSGEQRSRMPVGAEVRPDGVHFRVWAPQPASVSVLCGRDESLKDAREVPLDAETGGYWSGHVATATAGMYYRFRLDGSDYPDPASRFQPSGPHGPSQIIDPSEFTWTDGEWRG